MLNEFAPKIGENFGGGFGGEESAQGVRERKGVTHFLQAGKDLRKSFSGVEERADEVPELSKGVVKGNGDELNRLVGGGGVGRGGNLGGDGEVMKGSIGAVETKLCLEERGGAMGGEKPFAGSGGNVDLVNPFLSRGENLQKDFAVGGVFFGLKDLFMGEVPVGKERVGVARGEEEALRSVTFGQVAQKFEMGGRMGGGLREKGGQGEGVRGWGDGEGGLAKAGEGRFFLRF